MQPLDYPLRSMLTQHRGHQRAKLVVLIQVSHGDRRDCRRLNKRPDHAYTEYGPPLATAVCYCSANLWLLGGEHLQDCRRSTEYRIVFDRTSLIVADTNPGDLI